MSQLPSQDDLNELLEYDPATGELTWKRRDIRWFKTKRAHSVWNARFPGKPALSTRGDGRPHRQGYLLGKMERAHRVIWKIVYGVDSEVVDHIDGDPSNNRLENLRDVDQSGNMKNTALRCDNSTGFHGVAFDKGRGLYMAYVNSEGKRKYLGRFGTIEAAAAVRDAAANDLGFHENHGRAAS